MRKAKIGIFFILMMVSQVQALDIRSTGIKAGLGITTMLMDWDKYEADLISGYEIREELPSITPKTKAGFALSVHIEIGIFEEISLQSELGWSRRGFSHTQKHWRLTGQGNEIEKVEYDANVNMDYLTIPLLFRYNLNNNSQYIILGPQYDVLLKAKEENFLRYSDNSTYSIDDEYSSSDISFVIGLGIIYRNGICFDLRINSGLSEISEKNFNTQMRNLELILSLGYSLEL